MGDGSVHGSLRGAAWAHYRDELGPPSLAGEEGGPAGPKEDVMKLPRDSMSSLGRWPAWDSFTLVTCDKCNRNVKMEAIEWHLTVRHGTKSERSAYHRGAAARAAALLTCQVRLTAASSSPQHTQLLERLEDRDRGLGLLPTSSTSGSSLGSAGPSSGPHSGPASPQHNVHLVESSTTTPTRTPSPPLPPPALVETEEVVMETSPISPPHPPAHPSVQAPCQNPSPPPQHTLKQKPPLSRPPEDEADSTTNNVISIPESEDLPNIEIISDGIDLINTKFNFNSPALPPVPPSQPPQPLPQPPSMDCSSSSPVSTPMRPKAPPPLTMPLQAPGRVNAGGPGGPGVLGGSGGPGGSGGQGPGPPEPMEVCEAPLSSSASPQPTHYITVSPLSKCSPSPKKMVIGRLPAPQEKKLSGREREYDPNRHCGVWDSEQKRNCTRSLTCKSHSVYLKRKVINRLGPFDELLAQHKAEKEATTVRSQPQTQPTAHAHQPELIEARTLENTSILERRLKLHTAPHSAPHSAPHTGPLSGPSGAPGGLKQEQGGVIGRVVGSIQVLQPTVKAVTKEVYCDDSLHYTTDHPKPLAVCTFGGKRIGGLFITDRPRLFTRKVMKLAMGRAVPTPVARQQSLPYIVNFQSGAVQGLQGLQGLGQGLQGLGQGLQGLGQGHTIKLAGGTAHALGSSLQPQGLKAQQITVVQEAFNADLGDFKGGLKFELGGVPRQMHQIVPSASDGPG